MRFKTTASVILVFINISSGPVAGEEYFGKFLDGPEGRFEDWVERPKFKLTKRFGFEDPNGLMWPVPEGTIVDGASIPQFLWSVIGGPFEGAYLKASVVHDHYCDIRTRNARDTHLDFYYGMRANYVEAWRAEAMYWAVRAFGPDWRLERRVTSSWDCSLPSEGVPTCTTMPKIEEKVIDVGSIDLQDPEILAVAIGKFNAIVKTLKTSGGRSLDVLPTGVVGVSIDSIETNAASFREALATGSFRSDPYSVGIIAEPRQVGLDEIANWPDNKLPVLTKTRPLENSPRQEDGPILQTPGDLETYQQGLELRPTRIEKGIPLK
ncbi:DUF1353 domain-containing protein [Rhizobium sullae]|uniref:DUF1353 domain-containing protein n=1 Tax=Rhizobium sullae TaxID=50338 RepID=UPI000B35B036|nr:DUF1353 domain-containing protein [Rhizobium sullae]